MANVVTNSLAARSDRMTTQLFPLALLVACVATSFAADLPENIPPSDKEIRYIGRFDLHDPATARCSWSGATVMAKFKGTAINVKMKTTRDEAYYQLIVDGKPTTVLEITKSQEIYPLATGLENKEHVVEVFKATEPYQGTDAFTGFQLEKGGKLLPLPKRPDRRIEFYGDSITCGYGNMAASQKEKFSAATENNWYAYGAVAARALNAEYSCIAVSGIKVWQADSLPTCYDLTLFKWDNGPKWDFSTWIPQVVVINLCTNDFGGGAPDEKGWTDAYRAFIADIRKHYPECTVFCAVGSMMNGANLETVRGYLTRMVNDLAKAGDKKIHYVEMSPQNMANGIGADWHPNVKTDQIMADELGAEIKKVMKW